MAQVISDWICIATSGPTVDGRIIDPQWLIDCAETYNRDTYTALIWPRHEEDPKVRDFTFNLGEVDTLKYEEHDGKIKLFAKVIPNQFLIEANKIGQKLFSSVEIWPNFGDAERNYLVGLAATDVPASLGTQRFLFSINGKKQDCIGGNIEILDLGETRPKEEKTGFFWRFFSALGKDLQDPQETQPTGEDKAKMDELKQLIETLMARIDALEAKAGGEAENPEQAAADVADIAEEISDVAGEVADLADEVAENPEDEVKAAEFSVAKSKLDRVIRRYTHQKPAKRVRKYSHPPRKPAATAKDNELTDIKGQLSTILQKFSVMENRQTLKPHGAPGTGDKFSFL
ncbi:GPO family capsid scaffolding protein [Photorhabdus tasmaniensis]|uniref:Phage capsid protein n=1 Tax=Photorhabdus tasmaniensis TaxID=1004159 RepID=A0ABX0GEI3_9GAMM|nr:GPO family capsid scaffolding protein [Photorhabdus tasmaniensis]NHB87179.1 phage capsid protein [Photorhabdus tasmaniensis]